MSLFHDSNAPRGHAGLNYSSQGPSEPSVHAEAFLEQFNEVREHFYSMVEEAVELISGILDSHGILEISRKNDGSLVTNCELKIEQRLRELIGIRFPKHGIQGEEIASNPNLISPFQWILDPIDGSCDFVNSRSQCATLIGLSIDRVACFGAAYDIASRSILLSDGSATFLNGVMVAMPLVELSTARLSIAENGITEMDSERLSLLQRFRHIQGLNPAAVVSPNHPIFSLCLGQTNVHVELALEPWDILPLIPIVKGMGGTISGLLGKDPLTECSMLIAHSSLHPKILAQMLKSLD